MRFALNFSSSRLQRTWVSFALDQAAVYISSWKILFESAPIKVSVCKKIRSYITSFLSFMFKREESLFEPSKPIRSSWWPFACFYSDGWILESPYSRRTNFQIPFEPEFKSFAIQFICLAIDLTLVRQMPSWSVEKQIIS